MHLNGAEYFSHKIFDNVTKFPSEHAIPTNIMTYKSGLINAIPMPIKSNFNLTTSSDLGGYNI